MAIFSRRIAGFSESLLCAPGPYRGFGEAEEYSLLVLIGGEEEKTE